MMEWTLELKDIERFLLVFSRVGGIFVFAPFFGNRSIPVRVKILLSIIISFLLFLALGPEIPPQSPLFKGGGRPLGTGFSGEVNLMSLAIFILYEIGLGVIIAFVANLIFIGVQMAGHIVDQQIGFSIANTIDLSFHAEVSLMASFQSLLALILFLSVDGHHLLLQGIRSSFELIPLGGARYEVPLLSYVAGLFNSIFVIALKVSSPVIMTIFLTNVSLGMLARVMPQMNIFMVGFPLQIAVGLLTLAASIQVFGYLLINELDKLKTEISIVLNHFH